MDNHRRLSNKRVWRLVLLDILGWMPFRLPSSGVKLDCFQQLSMQWLLGVVD